MSAFPAFTPAEAGALFANPWEMQGWVDMGGSDWSIIANVTWYDVWR